MNKNNLFKEELINTVDLEAAPPTEEPERQYYYIAKARKYVKALSEKLGRPLFAHVTTFGWPKAWAAFKMAKEIWKD